MSDPATEPSPEPTPATPASSTPPAPEDPRITRANKQAETERKRRATAQAEAETLRTELDELRARLDGDDAKAAQAQRDRELAEESAKRKAAEKVARRSAFNLEASRAGVGDDALDDLYTLASVETLELDGETGTLPGLAESIASVLERIPGMKTAASTNPKLPVVNDAPGAPSDFDPKNAAHVRKLSQDDPVQFRKLLDNGTISIQWDVGGGELVEQSASRSGGLQERILKIAGKGQSPR